jgi:hypothetical protein
MPLAEPTSWVPWPDKSGVRTIGLASASRAGPSEALNVVGLSGSRPSRTFGPCIPPRVPQRPFARSMVPGLLAVCGPTRPYSLLRASAVPAYGTGIGPGE